MLPRSKKFLLAPFLVSLLGIAFSCWNIWGDTELLCVTEGCALFQNFTVAGVSMWWIGVTGFLTLALCAAFGAAAAGAVLTALGLLADVALLAIMLVTAPCFNCLVVALVLPVNYVLFRNAIKENGRKKQSCHFSALLGIWLLFFIVNVGAVLQSFALPWAFLAPPEGAPSAPVQIYISPSCPACRDLMNSTNQGTPAAWYPVAEQDSDLAVIAEMARLLDNGSPLNEALSKALAAKPVLSPLRLLQPDTLLLQLRLWKNKAHVLRAGSERLPFVEYRGLPAHMVPQAKKPEPAPTPTLTIQPNPGTPNNFDPLGRNTPENSTGLPFLDITGFCEGNTEDCE